jgi:hypothetical protein
VLAGGMNLWTYKTKIVLNFKMFFLNQGFFTFLLAQLFPYRTRASSKLSCYKSLNSIWQKRKKKRFFPFLLAQLFPYRTGYSSKWFCNESLNSIWQKRKKKRVFPFLLAQLFPYRTRASSKWFCNETLNSHKTKARPTYKWFNAKLESASYVTLYKPTNHGPYM